jgi:hypothetical protein
VGIPRSAPSLLFVRAKMLDMGEQIREP